MRYEIEVPKIPEYCLIELLHCNHCGGKAIAVNNTRVNGSNCKQWQVVYVSKVKILDLFAAIELAYEAVKLQDVKEAKWNVEQ